MFRHSEIQTLLRERRHKMENRDASEHSSAELEDIGEEAVQNPILEGDEEEEYARFLEREQEQIRPETVTKKRKRSYKAEERWDEPDRGDRWIARELDGAIVQHEDLDYGDDAATESLDQDGFNEQRMQLERGRRRTVYEDDDNAGAVTSVAGDRRVEIPLQKKSFLWPSVGI